MIRVAFDDSPLHSGHAGRGVGSYTRLLKTALQALPDVEVVSLDEKEASGANILHYPYFDLFFPTLPLRKRLPTVVTIHDVIPLLFPKAYPPGKRGKIMHLKQKIALKSAKAIITDSEASKTDIVRHLGVKAEKVHVVYLAAAREFAPANQSEIDAVRKKYHLPKTYILYVGDINYNKNLPQLIKSLKFLPDEVHLVCVGKNFVPQGIPEWQAIETQIALSNVAERVTFVTTLESPGIPELAAIYSGAICYVQPSLYEGFGLPVLEAMQSGTPVVAAHNSSLTEVGGERALYAEPEAECMAQQVKQVLAWSESERSAWLKKATKWASTFTWKKTAEATLAVYNEVL